MATTLFVYGTLKRGDVRAYLLEGQQYLGEAATLPRFKLYNTGDYPALVDAEQLGVDGLSIEGELWQVDEKCLTRLDIEEGVDEGLYERRIIDLMGIDGPVQSYFYLYPVEGMADCGRFWGGAC